MPNGSFGRVIGRLRLRHIDNGAGHGADHDHGAFGLALHQMPRYFAGEKVCAVDIDTPKLLHAVWWVRNGIEILGKAGRGNQVIYLAVVFDNVSHDILDGYVVRHVAVMGGDFGYAIFGSVIEGLEVCRSRRTSQRQGFPPRSVS